MREKESERERFVHMRHMESTTGIYGAGLPGALGTFFLLLIFLNLCVSLWCVNELWKKKMLALKII